MTQCKWEGAVCCCQRFRASGVVSDGAHLSLAALPPSLRSSVVPPLCAMDLDAYLAAQQQTNGSSSQQRHNRRPSAAPSVAASIGAGTRGHSRNASTSSAAAGRTRAAASSASDTASVRDQRAYQAAKANLLSNPTPDIAAAAAAHPTGQRFPLRKNAPTNVAPTAARPAFSTSSRAPSRSPSAPPAKHLRASSAQLQQQQMQALPSSSLQLPVPGGSGRRARRHRGRRSRTERLGGQFLRQGAPMLERRGAGVKPSSAVVAPFFSRIKHCRCTVDLLLLLWR